MENKHKCAECKYTIKDCPIKVADMNAYVYDSKGKMFTCDGFESKEKEQDKRYIVLDIETTGLKPWFEDSITCICAKIGDKIFSVHRGWGSEANMLRALRDWLLKFKDKPMIITKNGKMFDIPFILARASIYEINYSFLSELIDRKHFDLHEITDGWVHLADMAKLLCCKNKSGKGIDAIQLAKDKKWDVLAKYCMNDVEVTEQTYLKYMRLKNDSDK